MSARHTSKARLTRLGELIGELQSVNLELLARNKQLSEKISRIQT